jgi:hypothetical protein
MDKDLCEAIGKLGNAITSSLRTYDTRYDTELNTTEGLFAIASAIKGLSQAVYDLSHTFATPEVGDALRGLAALQCNETHEHRCRCAEECKGE